MNSLLDYVLKRISSTVTDSELFLSDQQKSLVVLVHIKDEEDKK